MDSIQPKRIYIELPENLESLSELEIEELATQLWKQTIKDLGGLDESRS